MILRGVQTSADHGLKEAFATKNRDKITESLKHIFQRDMALLSKMDSLAIELIENEDEVNFLNQYFLTEVQQSTSSDPKQVGQDTVIGKKVPAGVASCPGKKKKQTRGKVPVSEENEVMVTLIMPEYMPAFLNREAGLSPKQI